MRTPTIKVPSRKTLDKYGLDSSDWKALVTKLLPSKTGAPSCAVCGRIPESGKLFIDHEHVPGYGKLPGQQRKLAVRGLLCYQCNRFRVSKNTYLTALAVVQYLEKHEDRKRRYAAA